jgi:hypothetical protein
LKEGSSLNLHRLIIVVLDQHWENEQQRQQHLKQWAVLLEKLLNYDSRDQEALCFAKSLTQHAKHCLQLLPYSNCGRHVALYSSSVLFTLSFAFRFDVLESSFQRLERNQFDS